MTDPAMTARPCCGACGRRRGDEMTQRPDRGCFPRPDGGDGSVVSTFMQPRGCFLRPDGWSLLSLPSALSSAAVVSTCKQLPSMAPPS
jgi:hypothetical protein